MIDVVVPSVGESISEVTIGSWLKNDGDFVQLDEPICSIESDKATREISAPQAGKLKIVIAEGETVEIGAKIAEVDETQTAGASTPAPTQETKAPAPSAPASGNGGDKNYPSPAAGKILAEKGVDPSTVSGSGKDGRITKADALSAQAPTQAPKASDSDIKNLAAQTMAQSFSRDTRREKMTGLRKTIASRLVAA